MIQELFSTLFQVIVPLSIPVSVGCINESIFAIRYKTAINSRFILFKSSSDFRYIDHAEVSHQDIYLTLLFPSLICCSLGNSSLIGKLFNFHQKCCRSDPNFFFYQLC